MDFPLLNLPQIPIELIGTSDDLDVSILRLVSHRARSVFTPCVKSITIGSESDRLLSALDAPFTERTIVRLESEYDSLSLLFKYPKLWSNVKRVVCLESYRESSVPYAIDHLFPKLESFEIRCMDNSMDGCFMVDERFTGSKFRGRELIIEANLLHVTANLDVRDLDLFAEHAFFEPTVRITAENLTLSVNTHTLPGSLVVGRSFRMNHCTFRGSHDQTRAVLQPVFRYAMDVALISGNALDVAYAARAGMAAKTLALEPDHGRPNLHDFLSRFFADGPTLVERLTLREVSMDCLSCLYGLRNLQYLDMTPAPSAALRAPPAGLASLIVRFCPSFFGHDIRAMTTYVDALRVMCLSQRVQRLSAYLYDVPSQSDIRETSEPTMTLHDGSP
jgi:hypothetical protein